MFGEVFGEVFGWGDFWLDLVAYLRVWGCAEGMVWETCAWDVRCVCVNGGRREERRGGEAFADVAVGAVERRDVCGGGGRMGTGTGTYACLPFFAHFILFSTCFLRFYFIILFDL